MQTAEVENLVDLLERHQCLGDLIDKNRDERIAAFISEEQADRQLLVALHVLTRGEPFEHIVLGEYEKVNPEQARRLYADIATMNQFSVTVRAGTISRIAGIDFKDYEDRFFQPLKDIIVVGTDPYTGDATYRTRHQHVAQILFGQVFIDDYSKCEQFKRLISGLDVGYSSDQRALESICRGRKLAETFTEAESVRLIFIEATKIAPKQAYLFQQWAIFESNHHAGSFIEAESLAKIASDLQPRNATFIHTQAEVARKRANRENSLILKEQLRRHARALLNKMPAGDRFATSSRCKLLVDEVSDLCENLGNEERAVDDRFLAEKLEDAESALSRAQQSFSDDAEMIEIEARLWEELKDKDKALKALERAWKKVPRGVGTAIRLAKIYGKGERAQEQHDILQEALRREPDDKAAHMAMANYLIARPNVDNALVERHYRGSFSSDDQDFEARFMLAQFLFYKGDIEKSVDLFAEIDRRAPRNFRKFSPKQENVVTARLPNYTGSIDSVRATHCFIRSGAYPSKIFSHRDAYSDEDAENVAIGVAVQFNLRFNRIGPVAVKVFISGQ